MDGAKHSESVIHLLPRLQPELLAADAEKPNTNSGQRDVGAQANSSGFRALPGNKVQHAL